MHIDFETSGLELRYNRILHASEEIFEIHYVVKPDPDHHSA
jgi:hypothetical protein